MVIACVNDLLNTVHVGGEGGDNQPSVLILGENSLKRRANCTLGGGKACTLGICGLAKQKGNTILANLGNTAKIHNLTVNRRHIKLEVACVEDNSHRSFKRNRTCICDRMIHVNKLGLENTEIENITCLHRVKLGDEGRGILVKLSFNNTEGKACSVNWNVYLLKKVGNCSDMILVAMGDENTTDLVSVFHKI